MYLVKAAESTLVQKIHTFNVDEIDTLMTPRHSEQMFKSSSCSEKWFQIQREGSSAPVQAKTKSYRKFPPASLLA